MTWRPIDTAPKDGTWVLASIGEGLPVIVQFSQYGAGWQTMDDGPYTALTHWMPLPAPPPADREPRPCSVCRRDDCTTIHAAE